MQELVFHIEVPTSVGERNLPQYCRLWFLRFLQLDRLPDHLDIDATVDGVDGQVFDVEVTILGD